MRVNDRIGYPCPTVRVIAEKLGGSDGD